MNPNSNDVDSTWQAELVAMKVREAEAQRRIEQLEQMVGELISGRVTSGSVDSKSTTAIDEGPAGSQGEARGADPDSTRALMSRRGLVRLAGAGTAAVAAGVAISAQPVAATPNVIADSGTAFYAPLTIIGGGATLNSTIASYVGGLVAVGPDGNSIPSYPDGPGSVWAKVRYSPGAGSWRKVAGFDTAGSLHVIAPVRVYDSRLPSASSGLLAQSGTRTLSVANSIDVDTGKIVTADAIPVNARAIVGNLTVIAVSDVGYLYVAPGGTPKIGGSTINWTSSSAVIANGFTCALDGLRQLVIFASAATQCQFIIDVSGYYL